MTESNDKKATLWSKNDWLLLGMNTAIFIVLFLVFNSQLPDTVASHYNINGEADRTMTKWGFWLFNGALTVALPALLSLMRYVDPRKSNYSRFEGYYHLIRWAISLFLHSVMLIVILDNVGHKMPMLNLVLGGIGILWIIIGNRMGQVRSNFFVGIRTPWALMDERNWRLTHRFAARLWVAAGIVMFVSAWFASIPWIAGIVIVCALTSALIPALYSYLIFKNKTEV